MPEQKPRCLKTAKTTTNTPNGLFSQGDLHTLIRRSVLYALPLILALDLSLSHSFLTDPDIGWHFATGQWILEHHTTPSTDPFSIYGSGKPWVAYSWLFDVLVHQAYEWLGLIGWLTYVVLLNVAIALALLLAFRSINPDPAITVGLVSACLVAMAPLMQTPRSWLFNIFFYAIELHLLHLARRQGSFKPTWTLPALFFVWANLHIQFIYGLFALGLFALEPLISRLAGSRHRLPVARNTGWVLTSCCAATLLTPSDLNLYKTLLLSIQQEGVFKYISEMQAMDFRTLSDWFTLALTLFAFFLMGRSNRPFIFYGLLITSGLFISFRAHRDVWFIVVPCGFYIATSLRSLSERTIRNLPVSQVLLASTITLGFSAYLIHKRDVDNIHLQQTLGKYFPVNAVTFIKQKPYPGPLFNHFNWGGFLIWQLPAYPVSMDGRAIVHGDERIQKASRTWDGAHDWIDNSEFQSANLIIVKVDQPLNSLLAMDKKYTRIYDDGLASVYVKNDQ